MTGHKKAGIIGLLLGSPLALIGLIFLLNGKFALGLIFLAMGLPATGTAAVAVLSPDPATGTSGQQPAASPGDKLVEPGTSSEKNKNAT